MNYLIKFLFCFFFTTMMSGQQWGWANHFDFSGIESRSQIGGTDREGNLYLTVWASSADHRDPWADYYLLKVDQKGKLHWNKKINEYASGKIVTDSDGNSFIAASDKIVKFDSDGNSNLIINTSLQRSFGNIILTKDNILVVHGAEVSGDSSRAFISTYDKSGQFKSLFYVHRSKISSSNGTDFYVAEEAYPDPITGNQGYLYKYDNTGSLIFHKSIPHTPTTILTDESGAVYIYGWHVIFPININGIIYSKPGYYLVKYDGNGNLLWYKIIEGSLGGSSIALDEDDNLYYTAAFSTTLKLNEWESNTPTGMLVAKIDSEGKMIWHSITPLITGASPQYASPEQIYVNPEKEIFVSGRIYGTVQFGTHRVESSSDMYSELFVGKIDQNNLVGIATSVMSGNTIQVYPNPSGDVFSVLVPPDVEAEFIITDLNGRIISTQEMKAASSEQKIDLSAYSKGVYFLQIKTKEGIETKKLIRN